MKASQQPSSRGRGIRSLQRLAWVATFLGTGSLLAVGGDSNPIDYPRKYTEEVSLHRLFVSNSQDCAARALRLEVSYFGPAGQVTQDLVEAPDGTRVILRSVLNARRGLDRTRLTDEASGWWVELTLDYERTFLDLDQFFAFTLDQGEQLGAQPVRLVTQSGISLGGRFKPSAGEKGRYLARFVDHLLAEGELARLGEQVPRGLAPLLGLADPGPVAAETGSRAALYLEYGEASLAHLLNQALRAAGKAARPACPGPWDRRREGPARPSLTISDPDLLELVARFPSVENTDPLPRREIDLELAPAPADPKP